MPAYKEKNKGGQVTWKAVYRYKDLRTNAWRQTTKRGFSSQLEALTYEQKIRMSSSGDMRMTFRVFYEECYLPEVEKGMKPTTLQTKNNIVETHIYPTFADVEMTEISPRHILAWMNMLRSISEDGSVLSNDYLRLIYSTLRAIFNHAATYYPFENPMLKTKNFPVQKRKEKVFWTLEQYYKFASCFEDDGDPVLKMLFETMMFSGLRISECLALCKSDVQDNIIRVDKNLQRIDGEDVLLSPKTLASDRYVLIPDFLAEELRKYILRLPIQDSDSRLFPVSRNSVYRCLRKYSDLAQIPRITPHGFRHSYITMMLHNGCDPIDLCPNAGHNKPATLYRYAHAYPDEQIAAVNNLNDQWLKLSGREV